MVTCDGAGGSHGLIAGLDELAARRGYQLTYSVGWELGERERRVIRPVPEAALAPRRAVRRRRPPHLRRRKDRRAPSDHRAIPPSLPNRVLCPRPLNTPP